MLCGLVIEGTIPLKLAGSFHSLSSLSNAQRLSEKRQTLLISAVSRGCCAARGGGSCLNNETGAVVSLQVVKFAVCHCARVRLLGDVTGCCGVMLTVEAKKLSRSL